MKTRLKEIINKNNVRNSNFEMLRVIAIFFVIFSHYSVNSVVRFDTVLNIGKVNRLFLEVIVLGNLGVVIFFMLSGYFLIQKENPFKFNKFIKLFFQALFYSAVIYLVLIILSQEKLTFNGIIQNFFPLTQLQYYYVTIYISVYLLSPLINNAINKLNNKEILKYLIIIGIIVSLLPMILKNIFISNYLIEGIYFYLIGAYLYLSKNDKNTIRCKIKEHPYKSLLLAFILWLTFGIINILLFKYGLADLLYLYERRSITTILIAVLLMIIFESDKLKVPKRITKISPYVFGIYLIHEHPLLRFRIWRAIDNTNYAFTRILPIQAITLVVVVFSICLAIEALRANLVEKPLFNLYDKLKNKKIVKTK